MDWGRHPRTTKENRQASPVIRKLIAHHTRNCFAAEINPTSKAPALLGNRGFLGGIPLDASADLGQADFQPLLSWDCAGGSEFRMCFLQSVSTIEGSTGISGIDEFTEVDEETRKAVWLLM
jgi:hypothetical protein